jgi:hypothetical protein
VIQWDDNQLLTSLDASTVIKIIQNALPSLDFHKENANFDRINSLSLFRDFMFMLQSSERCDIINEIMQGIGKRKVKRIYAHLEVASCLESEDFRWHLATTAATETMRNKVLEFPWPEEWKNKVRESGYCKLLYVCLEWLLQSVEQYCAIELPSEYKEKLKEYPIKVHQYAFDVIKNKAKEWTDVEGVVYEVNIYLNLLIEQLCYADN